jgi:hypothetical protein
MSMTPGICLHGVSRQMAGLSGILPGFVMAV